MLLLTHGKNEKQIYIGRYFTIFLGLHLTDQVLFVCSYDHTAFHKLLHLFALLGEQF